MGMRILIAEDSPSYAVLYKRSLEPRGHNVTITENGKECFYLYLDEISLNKKNTKKPSPYDLVILDHKMPRMSGTETAKEIIELNPKQRILFVTGHVKEMMKGVRAIGEKIELLQKPFPIKSMIRQVEGKSSIWTKKMLKKSSKETWDGEGLSEPI